MNDLGAAALSYVPRTVPLGERSKRPVLRDWPNWTATRATVTEHWSHNPTANVGIRTGRGLVVLDIDPRAGGHDVLADLEHEHGELPETIEVATGGGGRHLYFAGPLELASFDLGAGVEIKSNGRQVVAPPSVHPDTGALYEWREGHAPGQITRAELPHWIATRRSERGPAPAPADTWTAMLRSGLAEGERNVAMARLAGHLLARRVDPRLVLEIVRLVAAHRCRPAMDEREAVRVVESIAGRELRRLGAQR